ncbi:MAG: nicotinate-nucleotide adenylyltransferase [Burkholderiales bacterium]
MKSGLNPVGVFGGTFDPVHFGHLRLAQEVAERCGLESVRIIPAGIPPHRTPPHCEASHRMEMVRIAAEGNPLFIPDEREVLKTSPCYSVETLLELRSELGPDKPLCLMVGADAFLGFPAWHRWRELFDLAHILVAQRPGFDIRSAITGVLGEEYAARSEQDPAALRRFSCGRIVTLDITLLDISASTIRECFAKGASARYLLPEGVLDYIQNHGLYREKHAV